MENTNYDHLVKFLFIGDSGVGKSSILLRYDENKFTSNFLSTIGIDYRVKFLDVDNKKIKLQIWDTAGQERYRTITQAYFRGAMAIILVYDVTDPLSFNNIRNWVLTTEKNASENVILVLVASKTDLDEKRIVSTERGKALADEYGITFYETSAKLNTGINELFAETIHHVVEKFFSNNNKNHDQLQNQPQNQLQNHEQNNTLNLKNNDDINNKCCK